ncbi:helix-turn-helix domain-containing protein [Adonisia turfae]|nr:helix-turn-helix domain-containing protein [Adonisia turfae]
MVIDPADVQINELPSVALANKNQLPKTPSIYFAIDSEGTVQYIGRSENLNRRWLNHHRHDQFVKMNGVKIAYIDCPTELLSEVESALIEWFKPALNGVQFRFPKPYEATPVSRIGIRWKLRAVMAERKISNAALGKAIGKHETTISRLRQRDTLPAIGNDEIEALRVEINKIATAKDSEFPICRLSDLVEVVEDD